MYVCMYVYSNTEYTPGKLCNVEGKCEGKYTEEYFRRNIACRWIEDEAAWIVKVREGGGRRERKRECNADKETIRTQE